MMYVEFMKNFYSPIRATSWLLDPFWPPELENVSFSLSRHDVRRAYEKFYSPIRATSWLLDSFQPPEPKNVWFPLSRHDVSRVHEIFSFRRFEQAHGCYTHFGLLRTKTFHSHFLDMMYVEFMKNFYSQIRATSWLLDSFRPPDLKNVPFPLSRHDVRRVHEKFYSPIRATSWLLDSFRPREPKND